MITVRKHNTKRVECPAKRRPDGERKRIKSFLEQVTRYDVEYVIDRYYNKLDRIERERERKNEKENNKKESLSVC